MGSWMLALLLWAPATGCNDSGEGDEGDYCEPEVESRSCRFASTARSWMATATRIFAHEGGRLVSVGRRCPQGEFASDVIAQDLDGDGRDDVAIDMQFDANEALLSTE
ncbi:MAG: hypothetical protein OXT09_31780 [Myxococcales bacterium]|nr:hypothetical protein [Myxococcales bacterium]